MIEAAGQLKMNLIARETKLMLSSLISILDSIAFVRHLSHRVNKILDSESIKRMIIVT